MFFEFSKYHGTGNDFIIIDDRDAHLLKAIHNKQAIIAQMCHRNYGIGADGLILLVSDKKSHFRMVYFNADGKEGSFCGNGARSVVAFAHRNEIIKKLETIFAATDGEHHATIEWFDQNTYQVNVQMGVTAAPEKISHNKYFANTGSPHLVILVDELSDIDVNKLGKKIRNSSEWSDAGVNVNFVKITGINHLAVKTYERGVERETLSCGTGVTAAAIVAYMHSNENYDQNYIIDNEGGRLEVSFTPPQKQGDKFNNIRLIGPAQFVYQGKYDLLIC